MEASLREARAGSSASGESPQKRPRMGSPEREHGMEVRVSEKDKMLAGDLYSAGDATLTVRASAGEGGRAQRGCEAVMLRASEHVPHDCAEHRARGPGEPGRHQASYRALREGRPAMPRVWTHGAACRSRAVRG